MNTFKTQKGTELPLMDLRGKAYLLVAHRIRWCKEEHPEWSIESEIVVTNDQYTISKATIRNESGRVMATAHKREDVKHFADALEKSETSAIGRALALCGYGTQFAPELDEEERIVDAPIERPKTSPVLKSAPVEGSLAALVATVKTRSVVDETKLYMRKNFGFEESARLNGAQITQVLGAIMSGEIKKAPVAKGMFDQNAGDSLL